MTQALTEEEVKDLSVTLNQKKDGWQNSNNEDGLKKAGMTLTGTPSAGGKATLSYSAESQKVTVTFATGE